MLVALASGHLGWSCSTRAASLSGLSYPPFVPTPAPVLSDWPFPSLLPGTISWPTDETSLWGTSEPCWPLSLMDRAVALLSFPVHPGPSSRPSPLLSKALMSQFSFPRLCVRPVLAEDFPENVQSLCLCFPPVSWGEQPAAALPHRCLL